MCIYTTAQRRIRGKETKMSVISGRVGLVLRHPMSNQPVAIVTGQQITERTVVCDVTWIGARYRMPCGDLTIDQMALFHGMEGMTAMRNQLHVYRSMEVPLSGVDEFSELLTNIFLEVTAPHRDNDGNLNGGEYVGPLTYYALRCVVRDDAALTKKLVTFCSRIDAKERTLVHCDVTRTIKDIHDDCQEAHKYVLPAFAVVIQDREKIDIPFVYMTCDEYHNYHHLHDVERKEINLLDDLMVRNNAQITANPYIKFEFISDKYSFVHALGSQLDYFVENLVFVFLSDGSDGSDGSKNGSSVRRVREERIREDEKPEILKVFDSILATLTNHDDNHSIFILRHVFSNIQQSPINIKYATLILKVYALFGIDIIGRICSVWMDSLWNFMKHPNHTREDSIKYTIRTKLSQIMHAFEALYSCCRPNAVVAAITKDTHMLSDTLNHSRHVIFPSYNPMWIWNTRMRHHMVSNLLELNKKNTDLVAKQVPVIINALQSQPMKKSVADASPRITVDYFGALRCAVQMHMW